MNFLDFLSLVTNAYSPSMAGTKGFSTQPQTRMPTTQPSTKMPTANYGFGSPGGVSGFNPLFSPFGGSGYGFGSPGGGSGYGYSPPIELPVLPPDNKSPVSSPMPSSPGGFFGSNFLSSLLGGSPGGVPVYNPLWSLLGDSDFDFSLGGIPWANNYKLL